jgi:hypothetical protein
MFGMLNVSFIEGDEASTETAFHWDKISPEPPARMKARPCPDRRCLRNPSAPAATMFLALWSTELTTFTSWTEQRNASGYRK